MNIFKASTVMLFSLLGCASGGLLTPVDVTASSSGADSPPINLINNSGLTTPISADSLHSNDDDTFWSSSYSGGTGWLVFDMGSTLAVDGAILWQYNRHNLGDLGVSDFDIETSMDMTVWTTVMSDAYLPKSLTDTSRGVQESKTFNFTPQPARYMRLEIKDNHGSSALVALSEVKFTGTAIPEPSTLALIGVFGGGLLYLRRRRRI